MISVLLPSRGRPELLHESVQSLLQRATHPTEVQVIVGVDIDDDAKMLTHGWDVVIERHDASQPMVMSIQSNHEPHLCCFPVVTSNIVQEIGHMSLSPHVDSWLHEVGLMAGCFRVIPVAMMHHRYDLTGENDDKTYREGLAGYRSDEFNAMRPLMQQDAQKVVDLMKRNTK